MDACRDVRRVLTVIRGCCPGKTVGRNGTAGPQRSNIRVGVACKRLAAIEGDLVGVTVGPRIDRAPGITAHVAVADAGGLCIDRELVTDIQIEQNFIMELVATGHTVGDCSVEEAVDGIAVGAYRAELQVDVGVNLLAGRGADGTELLCAVVRNRRAHVVADVLLTIDVAGGADLEAVRARGDMLDVIAVGKGEWLAREEYALACLGVVLRGELNTKPVIRPDLGHDVTVRAVELGVRAVHLFGEIVRLDVVIDMPVGAVVHDGNVTFVRGHLGLVEFGDTADDVVAEDDWHVIAGLLGEALRITVDIVGGLGGAVLVDRAVGAGVDADACASRVDDEDVRIHRDAATRLNGDGVRISRKVDDCTGGNSNSAEATINTCHSFCKRI